MNWRRFMVSLFAALEIPFAVAAGINLLSNTLIALVFMAAAMVMTFFYAMYKPYWDNGSNGK